MGSPSMADTPLSSSSPGTNIGCSGSSVSTSIFTGSLTRICSYAFPAGHANEEELAIVGCGNMELLFSCLETLIQDQPRLSSCCVQPAISPLTASSHFVEKITHRISLAGTCTLVHTSARSKPVRASDHFHPNVGLSEGVADARDTEIFHRFPGKEGRPKLCPCSCAAR